MKINELELYLVELKRNEAKLPLRSLLVRLTTDENVAGWGEAAVAWRPDELSARRNALLPVVAGRGVFDIEDLLLSEGLRDPRLRCAVEMAFWDLIGRATGQPLCHLLGGAFRRRIPVAVRLPESSPHGTARIAREMAEQGFHCQVVSCTGDIQHDIEMFRAVRLSAGYRAELRIDGLEAYDIDSARELCSELENERLQFLIDPLKEGGPDSITDLARQTSVPLAAWRSVGSPSDAWKLSRRTSVAALVADPQFVGGLKTARKCAAVAESAGITALLGGQPSLGIGTAAMLQLAASTPAFSLANESAYHQLQDDVLSQSLETVDGMMAVPQSPGLGVEVDRSKVEKYQVG